MTNWEKLLDEHHMWFYQTGIAAVELPKKDFNSDFKEVLNYLRRLEDKLDRHMENNRG